MTPSPTIPDRMHYIIVGFIIAVAIFLIEGLSL